MNTHDKIELPPLPYVAFCRVSDIDPHDSHHRQLGVSADTRLYTEDQVRAAIKSDRQRRGDPVAYIRVIPYDDDGNFQRDIIEADKVGDLSIYADFVTFVPLYTTPQPAEPDGTLTNEGTKSDDPVGGEYPSNEWVTAFFGSPDDSGFYYFRGDFGNIAHRYKNSAKHLLPQPADPVVKDSLTVAEPVKVPSDAQINEITTKELGKWPSFEAQSWACKVVKSVFARYVHPEEPEGWQLVPIKPTEAMLNQGESEWSSRYEANRGYRAMLQAAPTYSGAPKRLQDMSKSELIDLIEKERDKHQMELDAIGAGGVSGKLMS